MRDPKIGNANAMVPRAVIPVPATNMSLAEKASTMNPESSLGISRTRRDVVRMTPNSEVEILRSS